MCKNPLEVKWRIENIRAWLETKNESLYSPRFYAKTIGNMGWKLRLARKWCLDEKCISLAVQRCADDHSEMVALNYKLTFLGCDGSELKSKTRTLKFAPKSVSQELKVPGSEILEEKKDAYFPEGILTICCKLWISSSTISRHCAIRTLIGRKCITLNGNIEYFNRFEIGSNATVNFLSPSLEISFISFNILRQPNNYLAFERTDVECQCFSSYTCKLFVLAVNGEQQEMVYSSNLATLLRSDKSCTPDSICKYFSYNDVKYLKNDTLTLKLEITYYPGVESECIDYDENCENLTCKIADLEKVDESSSEKELTCRSDTGILSEDKPCDVEKNETRDEDKCFIAAGRRNLPSTSLKEDLTSLYKDRLFCDTNLLTVTETFPAHRSVLSARSPVFKKMFTTDMKEKAGEGINITDISSDTVRRMLQFLYTDCTGYLDMQSSKDLYIASDKYDIASLKERCTSFMEQNLSPTNVCDILVLADMHQDKNLESAAQEYVLINDEDVFYSDEWKCFMKNYSALAAQVMYLKFTKK